ncbi:Elongation factor G [Geodia barretti]|uniref:Elongation factor G n=1 Tax=Geodia barretti TaxID=519541 RepID=A0AA35WZL1_GEOBA|nr:Elongation factor G [Geodia barretti]
MRTASKQDEDKLSEIIGRTADADPTFRVRYDGETRETVVAAIGELHLAVVLGRIRDSHKIEVETELPRVAYRETITRPAAADYQHKKQTGGHGQYAARSAREATKAALAQAKPALLEPVVDLVVLSDDQYLGDILSDLSSRRGRVLGQEPVESLQETRAQVPQAEMLRYSIDLKSMTSGTASVHMTLATTLLSLIRRVCR